MSAHSLCLSGCLCVRAFVRACVCACVHVCVLCLQATASTAPTLVFAASSFRCWTPNSIIHFCLTCCSPISGCVHMPNSPFDSSLLSVIGPHFVFLTLHPGYHKAWLFPPLPSPSPPRCVLPPALPFSGQRKRDSGSLGGSLTFVCASILHRPPHWSSTGPCCRAGPPPSGFS